jgi:hypothetical protein
VPMLLERLVNTHYYRPEGWRSESRLCRFHRPEAKG